jgi:hypothetical protein
MIMRYMQFAVCTAQFQSQTGRKAYLSVLSGAVEVQKYLFHIEANSNLSRVVFMFQIP